MQENDLTHEQTKPNETTAWFMPSGLEMDLHLLHGMQV